MFVMGNGARRGRLAQVQENDKPVLIYSTFPSPEAAEAVAQELVERRLAACVNILPGMTSIYRWEGAIARDSEAVMIIKTRAGAAGQAIAAVKARHSYANPALVVLPIIGGSDEYLRWLEVETAANDGGGGDGCDQ
jgi:periplasmic divalent cation tolerance protein